MISREKTRLVLLVIEYAPEYDTLGDDLRFDAMVTRRGLN